MSQYTPKSKGVATTTARLLRANAADIRQCASALEQAATYYSEGNYVQAHKFADYAFSQIRNFVLAWIVIRSKHLIPKPWPAFMRRRASTSHVEWLKRQRSRAYSLESLDA